MFHVGVMQLTFELLLATAKERDENGFDLARSNLSILLFIASCSFACKTEDSTTLTPSFASSSALYPLIYLYAYIYTVPRV